MATLSPTAPTPRAPGFSLNRWFAAITDTVDAFHTARAAAIEADRLLNLSDAELASMGLNRVDICREIRETYFDDTAR